ncbi:MAG TPA: hypothetical protein VGM42_06495, partial [Rhodopila sp.]
DGASVLVKENPVRLLFAATSDDADDATKRMAYPSLAPAFVIWSVQPAGAETLVGLCARKSFPGTQANQNVPIGVVLVSFRVMLYCQSVGSSWVTVIVAVAVSDMARLLQV